MESQVPFWICHFLLGDKGAQAGLLQLEEVQAQLGDMEHRILTHVAEEQDKSASKAAASLRLILLKDGMTTEVTEEVRPVSLPVLLA